MQPNVLAWFFVGLLFVSLPLVGQQSIVGLADTIYGATEVYYIGSDQHIRQLYSYDFSDWQYFDLTAATVGALPVSYLSSSITAIEDTTHGSPQVYYVGNDGHIHQFYYSGGWRDFDITLATGAPAPLPFSTLVGLLEMYSGTPFVFYIGPSQHIYYLRYDDLTLSWGYRDITHDAGAPPTAIDFYSLAVFSKPHPHDRPRGGS